tara:strand:- start:4189 stop:4569 length:381 start_codon:yes stop_codon:yes gene_type:complete
MNPTKKPNDIYINTMAQANLADKPSGVKILDWITDKAEQEGNRQRTVSLAVRKKIEAHEKAAAAKLAKAASKTANAAVKALSPTPPSLHATYRALQKSNPTAAMRYWDKNEAAIKNELAPSTFPKL